MTVDRQEFNDLRSRVRNIESSLNRLAPEQTENRYQTMVDLVRRFGELQSSTHRALEKLNQSMASTLEELSKKLSEMRSSQQKLEKFCEEFESQLAKTNRKLMAYDGFQDLKDQVESAAYKQVEFENLLSQLQQNILSLSNGKSHKE